MDIDIKLRSCKGSCQGYSEYQVDKESYVALDKQVRNVGTLQQQLHRALIICLKWVKEKTKLSHLHPFKHQLGQVWFDVVRKLCLKHCCQFKIFTKFSQLQWTNRNAQGGVLIPCLVPGTICSKRLKHWLNSRKSKDIFAVYFESNLN